jgi:alginate O-acetyltransferase complex protein AlgI
MVFSSQLFLYGFMPVFFSLYYLLGERWRNWLILAASLIFYSVGAGSIVFVLLVSVIVNQYLAVRIHDAPQPRRLQLLWVGIVVNLAGLAFYKYTDFVWNLASDLTASWSLGKLPAAPAIPLPIGISFFTFQAISYLADVYQRVIVPAEGYGEFAVYHTLFPQLVAGPIVRYAEVKAELRKRRVEEAILTEGAYRFCLGLGKKIVLADNLGTIADAMFALPPTELGAGHAWLGLLCYTLQIYFDFSGYSDMAIGLGRLLGLHFPENFDQPYRSASITEFWRRWHMTLSRWFRDYVYIPLGGNRQGSLRTYANLWSVFFLCGLWHGAGLTFVVWGLYHGSLLVIERLANSIWSWRPSGAFGVITSFLLVMIGWVFFRAATLEQAGHYLEALFGLGPAPSGYRGIAAYLTPDKVFYLALGLFFAFAPLERLARLRFDRTVLMAGQLALSFCTLVYASLLLAANSFNPFIYFRF